MNEAIIYYIDGTNTNTIQTILRPFFNFYGNMFLHEKYLEMRGQFHQHFMSTFMHIFLHQKKFKYKKPLRKTSVQKKPRVKCWCKLTRGERKKYLEQLFFNWKKLFCLKFFSEEMTFADVWYNINNNNNNNNNMCVSLRIDDKTWYCIFNNNF